MTRRAVLAAFGSFSAACVRNPRRNKAVDDGTVQRYHLRGTVVRREEQSRIVTIKHGRIANDAGKVWMDPMTMEFPVPESEDFAKLAVGLEVTADVVARSSDLEYWIEKVRSTK